MINIKDLRIDSLIQHSNGRVFSIVYASELVLIEGNPDKYQGIAITEDYLAKLGFTLQKEDIKVSGEHHYRLEPNESLELVYNAAGSKEPFMVSMHMQDEQDFRLEHVKYIHQLQNLVYALTEKDLTFPVADLLIV